VLRSVFEVGHALSVTSTEKPWWKTLMGVPEWMTRDEIWHGWAFAAFVLVFYAALSFIVPPGRLVGGMLGAAFLATMQAVRMKRSQSQ